MCPSWKYGVNPQGIKQAVENGIFSTVLFHFMTHTSGKNIRGWGKIRTTLQ